ncbi:SpoIIE family protein phosphatase [Streptomyces shenzhenensis]|uniref:SpoIIE family protein phosphatase n=1 Tax=Streptomyces shenzhenensis TaxID=943815 RepID=UPI0015F08F7F|nr:SpoIIE family protein phosphatase [Streptomyces shenzhenensis]
MSFVQPAIDVDHTGPFDAATAATVIVDARGAVIGWSPAAEDLFGRPAHTVVGRSLTEFLPDVAGQPPAGPAPGEPARTHHRTIRRPDGSETHIVLRTCLLGHPAGGAAWLVVAAEAERAERWATDRSLLDGLFTQSPIVLTIYGPDLRVHWINKRLYEELGFAPGEWIGQRISDLLPLGAVLSPPGSTKNLEEIMARVLETGEPVFDVMYGSPTPADPEHQWIWSCSYFRLQDSEGKPLGICESAFEITERYEEGVRLALLGGASRIGATLDVVGTAEDLARAAVPELADRAEIHVAEYVLTGMPSGSPGNEGGALRSVAERSCTRPPAPQPWLGFFGRSRADGAPHRIVLPLEAGGAVLGTASFTRTPPRHGFTGKDHALVRELVSRTAVALDNARRYAHEHGVALALQRSLLPKSLPEATAAEVAHRYVPAAGPLGVGGDWYDVIPLSGARVGLVVGDVVGHGLDAAATMGRLRTTVRALAALDLTPDELLTRLDDLVAQAHIGIHRPSAPSFEDPGLGTTCLYGVYDPVTGTLSVASAGHPSPVVAVAGQPATHLDLPVGPPLGIGGLPFESSDIHLPEGSRIALYTDGLVQTRAHDADLGLEALTRAMDRGGTSLAETCDSIITARPEGSAEDDAAILLVRVHALDADSMVGQQVPSDPSTVAAARTRVSRQLEKWGLQDMTFTAELVVSELVTNAIRYGEEPISFRLLRDRDRTLICEVSDGGHTSPYLRRATTEDEGGRGLFLVAQFTDRWGTRFSRQGKTIWTEFRLGHNV